MNNIRKLAATLTGAAAIAALFTVSASAETRHRDETNLVDRGDANRTDGNWRRDSQRSDGQYRGEHRSQDRNDGYRNDQRNHDRNDRGDQRNYDRNYRGEQRNYDRNYRGEQRNYDRNYRGEQRNYDRNNGYRNYDRNDNRGYDRHDGVRYDARGRRSFSGEGRVRTFRHEHGGYRVWLEGSDYPYWIPEARWRSFPLRVGLSVRIGGWLDPLGYIDAYDVGPYGAPVYTSGELRGVVESIDYGRGTLVLRDDLSGSFVTAIMRDGRMEDLRPGDYVALSGDWTRRGVFEAYRLDDVRNGY